MLVLHGLDYLVLYEVLKSGNENSPHLFFSKFVLALLSPLHFHTNFRIRTSSSARKKKKASWILVRITSNRTSV